MKRILATIFRTALCFALVILWSPLVQAQSANGNTEEIKVQFSGSGGITLQDIVAGAEGTGTLLYYRADRSPSNPSLAVRFTKIKGHKIALAEVFDVPLGRTSVPIIKQGDNLVVESSLSATIVMTATNGWWYQGDRANYNLDIQVNGPIASMWGSLDARTGTTGWVKETPPRQPSAAIMVRDPQNSGLPKWDIRTLLMPFPGRGYYRTNYAEATCLTETYIDRGPSPLWPFVAISGGFEQVPGILRPPIVVDWNTGKIVYFSELVSVRNQSCSYSFYSITRVKLGELNQANFETPFAFYDLAGAGKGYPNMILRTEHFPANDVWSAGMEPAIQKGQPVERDIDTIRYSWRTQPGDTLWDYKIEVLGFHPYTFQTQIADGSATIDAPSYKQFPSWVLEHEWPAVTFIDTEGNSYRSTEGIYEWSPREAGVAYALGLQPNPKPNAFSQLTSGFRGEYRLQRSLRPKLYASPVDNRIHLIGAEDGLWQLGPDLVLRVHRRGNASYINGWSRERLPFGTRRDANSGLIEEQLWALPKFLLYSDTHSVVLRQTDYQPAAFEINPPTDHVTWEAFRQRTAPLTAQKRDPRNMKSWLDAFPGQSLVLLGAQISDVRQVGEGFRFVLELPEGFNAPGSDQLDLRGLAAGRYVVSYNGRFSVEPFVEPTAAATPLVTSFTEHVLNPLPLSLRSLGNGDIGNATLEVQATLPGVGSTDVASQTVTLLAGEPLTTTLAWAPPLPGNWTLAPRLITHDGQIFELGNIAVTVRPSIDPTSTTILTTSTTLPTLPLVLLMLAGFVALAGVIAWQQGRVPTEEK